MVEEETEDKERSSSKLKGQKARRIPISDDPPVFKYRQFLGLILVLGFLIIGTSAGMYTSLQKAMETPCLGCLGLYPRFEIEFTFDTVDDRPHPQWILDALDDGPVFIEFTQNDINCPPCKDMRPKIAELEDEYSDKVTFFIINVNENENTKTFQGKEFVIPVTDDEETDVFITYDIENIGKGGPVTPTYIIMTLENDKFGNVRPYFAVGYGKFKDNNEEKTKVELASILDFALKRYEHNEKIYHSE